MNDCDDVSIDYDAIGHNKKNGDNGKERALYTQIGERKLKKVSKNKDVSQYSKIYSKYEISKEYKTNFPTQ